MAQYLRTALLFCVALTTVARAETWTDVSGTFRVEAEFIRLDPAAKAVVLKRSDGSVIAVPLQKLSDESRKLAESLSSASFVGKESAPDYDQVTKLAVQYLNLLKAQDVAGMQQILAKSMQADEKLRPIKEFEERIPRLIELFKLKDWDGEIKSVRSLDVVYLTLRKQPWPEDEKHRDGPMMRHDVALIVENGQWRVNEMINGAPTELRATEPTPVDIADPSIEKSVVVLDSLAKAMGAKDVAAMKPLFTKSRIKSMKRELGFLAFNQGKATVKKEGDAEAKAVEIEIPSEFTYLSRQFPKEWDGKVVEARVRRIVGVQFRGDAHPWGGVFLEFEAGNWRVAGLDIVGPDFPNLGTEITGGL